MTQPVNRRPPPELPQAADIPWVQARRAIFEHLRWQRANYSGVPGGFGEDTDPSTIEADTTASPGTESLGWAAVDHEHAVSTDPPGAITLGVTASEGSSTALARADHRHDTVQLEADIRALIEEEAYLSWVM